MQVIFPAAKSHKECEKELKRIRNALKRDGFAFVECAFLLNGKFHLVPIIIGDLGIADRELLKKKKLRVDEVTRILRISRASVYQMVKKGELEKVEGLKPLRIKTSSVKRLLEGS